ncbi:MAG: MFS transporter [Acetobacteraceae bacterium]
MTYAVNPAYGIDFPKDGYLWIPVLGDILAVIVIPFVGDLSDKIGRRPLIVVAAIGSGLLSFPYLYAISIKNIPLAIANSLLMWGVVWVGFAPRWAAAVSHAAAWHTACRKRRCATASLAR